MRFSAAAVLALAAVVSAQIDACDGKAQKCIDDAMVGTCDAGDYKCACENMADLQPKATGCVLTACGSPTGALEVIGQVEEMCKNIGNGEEPPAEETTDAEEPPAEETSGTEEPPAEETSAEEEPPTETDGPSKPCDKGCNGNDTETPEPTESGDGETPEPTETFAPGAAGAIAPIGALVAGLFALAL